VSRTMTSIITGVACASVFVTVPSTQQRASELSGHWLLAAATTTLGRSAEQGGVPQPPSEVPTKATTVSGAAFNCGRDCTIVQTNQTLTVEAALLGSDVSRASPVTFRLDEQEHLVTDSFNPGRELRVTAKWNAGRLEIVTGPRFRQAVSVESGQLVVVTSVMIEPAHRVTVRYAKKTPKSSPE
jgi:hypothetical protein